MGWSFDTHLDADGGAFFLVKDSQGHTLALVFSHELAQRLVKLPENPVSVTAYDVASHVAGEVRAWIMRAWEMERREVEGRAP